MKKEIKTGARAEYDTAKTIIMHTPGDELFWGCLNNFAALFEDTPFNRYDAIKEHKEYVQTLRDRGIDVLLVSDILLEGTLDKDGRKVRGKDLEMLIGLADSSFEVIADKDTETHEVTEAYKQKTLEAMHPKDLVKIILEQPRVKIKKSDEGNTALVPESYEARPVMNLHFLRDQQITTNKGIVMGKMNSSQRSPECRITRFVFEKLGAAPIYEITGDGRLEGGDFIPMGDYAMIGQGLRTNEEGVKQLLESGALGYEEVAVVKDSWKDQQEMHLDTYFNVLGEKAAVLLEDRMGTTTSDGMYMFNDPGKKTTVDIYIAGEAGYTLKEKDVPFEEYLKHKGFSKESGTLIPLTKEEQLAYGCNSLALGDDRAVVMSSLGDDEMTASYHNKLTSAGIEIVPVDLSTFVKTYGAPHCATQVVYRENQDGGVNLWQEEMMQEHQTQSS